MINPFILPYFERIKHWRMLRDSLLELPLEKQIKEVSNWCWKAPMVNFSLDYDKPKFWPNPWELIKENSFDTVARGLLMAETFLLADEKHFNKIVDLKYVYSYDIKNYFMAVIINEKYILNYEHNEIVDIDDKFLDCKIINSYVKKHNGWYIL